MRLTNCSKVRCGINAEDTWKTHLLIVNVDDRHPAVGVGSACIIHVPLVDKHIALASGSIFCVNGVIPGAGGAPEDKVIGTQWYKQRDDAYLELIRFCPSWSLVIVLVTLLVSGLTNSTPSLVNTINSPPGTRANCSSPAQWKRVRAGVIPVRIACAGEV